MKNKKLKNSSIIITISLAILISLNKTNFIHCSWWVVFIPLWLPTALAIIAALIRGYWIVVKGNKTARSAASAKFRK